MDTKETKEFLIWMAVVGCLLTLGSLFLNPELDTEFATIEQEPIFIDSPKFYRYEFSTREFPWIKYKIRYIYSNLTKNQKQAIINTLKKGVLIEIKVDNDRLKYDEKEVYIIRANGEDIFGLKDYESLRFREVIMSISFLILSFIGFIIFNKSTSKNKGCFILLLFAVGGLILVLYMKRVI